MKKIRYAFTILLIAYVLIASAQHKYIPSIHFKNQSVENRAGKVTVRMDMDISEMKLSTKEMLVLTPCLRSEDGTQSLDFPSVVINGANRQKAYDRGLILKKESPVAGEIQKVVKRNKKIKQQINYEHVVPTQDWMIGADLILKESVFGCANCSVNRSETAFLKIKRPFVPVYTVTYIEPEAEPVKARKDKHSASFNYVVNRFELLRNFGNNAKELAAVDKVISDVKSNPYISISDFAIAGYASPEGNFERNRVLARNRAQSFADYLILNHRINRSQFKVDGYGEDWEGLRAAVLESNIADKSAIINIIDDRSIAPDARDARLLKLSGGNTYRTLLQSFYPSLRRTDYSIAYVVRSFSVEEAKEIIKKNPKLLSLNEMYLVAQSYPPGSDESKEVFDIATRMYPDDPVVLINSTSTDIERNNFQLAIDRLHKIEKDPRAWNNLGVAYVRLGNTQKAADYFRKAAANKDAEAIKNEEQLKLYLEEQ